MNFHLKRFQTKLIYFFLYKFLGILDFIVWTSIQILPGRLFIYIADFLRPWKIFKLNLPNNKINFIYKKFIKIFNNLSKTKSTYSSCLSRSLTIRIILDILGIQNKLNFGISKLSNGRLLPHCWISDLRDNFDINEPINNKTKNIKF